MLAPMPSKPRKQLLVDVHILLAPRVVAALDRRAQRLVASGEFPTANRSDVLRAVIAEAVRAWDAAEGAS
jgi:hypothetical protein